jgi:hypothetical protein
MLSLVDHLPLTYKQKMVIAVKMLPQCAIMTEIEKAELAGVSERYYHTLMSNPDFKAILVNESRNLIASKAPECTHKYMKKALIDESESALTRAMEQQGVLDPPQRNVNLSGTITTASLTELKALIKEQQIDDAEILEVIETIDGGIACDTGGDEGQRSPTAPHSPGQETKREGSTPDEREVPGIPQESKGLSLSEKNEITND